MLTAIQRKIFRPEVVGTAAGFSLVELMIVLSVFSLLFAVGIPAFGRLLQDIEIRGGAEGLRAALQTARTEAVTRNALVRISFNDVSGRPAWTIGCVHASAHCPKAISTYGAQPEVNIRLGVARSDDAIALTVALTAGKRLPSGVTFNALGAAPGISAGVDASRIDVLHVANDKARRLILTIAAAGTVRLCDPTAANGSTFGCI